MNQDNSKVIADSLNILEEQHKKMSSNPITVNEFDEANRVARQASEDLRTALENDLAQIAQKSNN